MRRLRSLVADCEKRDREQRDTIEEVSQFEHIIIGQGAYIYLLLD